MQIGSIHPAGIEDAQYCEEYLTSLSRYFNIDINRLRSVLSYLEQCDKPEIVLIQNPDAVSDVKAVCFVSSVWSRSYQLLGCPHEQIHRDFHYQCCFCAMELLAQVGCTSIRVENLKTNYKFSLESYVCLTEALKNIHKYLNPEVSIQVMEGAVDQQMVDRITWSDHHYILSDHRLIAMNPYIRDGLSMSRIFLPEIQGRSTRWNMSESFTVMPKVALRRINSDNPKPQSIEIEGRKPILLHRVWEGVEGYPTDMFNKLDGLVVDNRNLWLNSKRQWNKELIHFADEVERLLWEPAPSMVHMFSCNNRFPSGGVVVLPNQNCLTYDISAPRKRKGGRYPFQLIQDGILTAINNLTERANCKCIGIDIDVIDNSMVGSGIASAIVASAKSNPSLTDIVVFNAKPNDLPYFKLHALRRIHGLPLISFQSMPIIENGIEIGKLINLH